MVLKVQLFCYLTISIHSNGVYTCSVMSLVCMEGFRTKGSLVMEESCVQDVWMVKVLEVTQVQLFCHLTISIHSNSAYTCFEVS
jgi:hypothetical protein